MRERLHAYSNSEWGKPRHLLRTAGTYLPYSTRTHKGERENIRTSQRVPKERRRFGKTYLAEDLSSCSW